MSSDEAADRHKHHGWGQYPSFCEGCAKELEQDRADNETAHEAHIGQLISDFAKGASEALRAVYAVEKTVTEMTSNQVYDIEMAEGSQGGDALHELDVALRALRHVERIARWRQDLDKRDQDGEG